MQANELRQWLMLGGVGVGLYVLYRLLTDLDKKREKIAKDVGNWFYDLTHTDFIAANFAQGVIFPDGRIMDIVKTTINSKMVFPKMGVLYTLKKGQDGKLYAVRSPEGTRYDYPDFYALQQSQGNAKVVDK